MVYIDNVSIMQASTNGGIMSGVIPLGKGQVISTRDAGAYGINIYGMR